MFTVPLTCGSGTRSKLYDTLEMARIVVNNGLVPTTVEDIQKCHSESIRIDGPEIKGSDWKASYPDLLYKDLSAENITGQLSLLCYGTHSPVYAVLFHGTDAHLIMCTKEITVVYSPTNNQCIVDADLDSVLENIISDGDKGEAVSLIRINGFKPIEIKKEEDVTPVKTVTKETTPPPAPQKKKPTKRRPLTLVTVEAKEGGGVEEKKQKKDE